MAADLIALNGHRMYHPDVVAALELLEALPREPGYLVAMARDCIRALDFHADGSEPSPQVCQAIMDGAFIAWLALGEFIGLDRYDAIERIAKLHTPPPAA